MDWLQNLLNTELSEPWTRALAVLGLAILVGFLAKLLLTSVVARATRRTGTEIDDKVVRILASPIFTTSLLVGIYYAVKLLESDPEAPGSCGSSPRGGIWLVAAARARAAMLGRDFALPEDVKDLAPDVLRHRLVLTFEAHARGVDSDEVVARVLDAVPVP